VQADILDLIRELQRRFDLSRLLDFMQTPRTFDHDTFRRWLLSAEETFIRELTSVVDRE